MTNAAQRSYTTTWRVRSYELDANGHVNNSVYVAYAEEVANQHAEAIGFGRAWTQQHAGTWVARRHAITYFLAATYGDELELTTEVAEMRGARAIRNTVIRLVRDGRRVVEMQTEWVWVRLSDGRPSRIPATAVAAFGGHVSGA
ncbi:MAG TPA: acyl-CoA thioesterase [Chloroflexota bacterium]|nr:acyl-CoA thioesterase [Chloroflexota bacterium]